MQPRIALSLTLLLVLAPLAFLTADDATSSVERGPQAEEFYRLQGRMNALLGELAGLQVKYRTADEQKRTEIQLQWEDLIAKGEKIEPPLLEAAEKAYAEAPNADKQITDFLMNLLVRAVNRDDFEPAAKIGALLMTHKCQAKQLRTLAGVAALATSDFDTAEQYLSQAKSNHESLSVGCDYVDNLIRLFLNNPQHFKQAWEKEAALRQQEAEADDLPRVLLKTNKGDIVIELFENQAPNTVANFISLVKKGFYDGLTFHRVLPGFMAQGGDPTGNGTGGPDYSIACECYRPDHRQHFRGTLSMAHAGRDTGGSQFFLTFVPTSNLDGMHTAFGRVISGMDVLAKLQRRDPDDKEAPRPDKIVKAEVLRKRPHEYVPRKMP